MRIFIFLSLLCCALISNFTLGDPNSEETQIIIFNTHKPIGKPQEGYCWTNSLMVARNDAWRCMIGNLIQDPCFSISHDAGHVICGASPVRDTAGFLLKLTKPLPEITNPDIPLEPWLIELVDASICTSRTGTLTFINNKPLKYSCSCPEHKTCEVSSGILNIDKKHKLWQAHKVSYKLTGNTINIVDDSYVAVKKAWQ